MDRYYHLIELETSDVPVMWKVIHVACTLSAIAFSLADAYCVQNAMRAFDENNYLFANIIIKDLLAPYSDNMSEYLCKQKPIDMINSDWGTDNVKNFCEFIPIVSGIAATILAFFFLVYSKGGAGYISDGIIQPWRIVYPALAVSLLLSIIALSNAIVYTRGLDIFCAAFEPVFGTKTCIGEIDFYTKCFVKRNQIFYVFAKSAEIFGYLTFVVWFLLLISLVARVLSVADFQLVRITVKYNSRNHQLRRRTVSDSDVFYVYESFRKCDNKSFLKYVGPSRPSESIRSIDEERRVDLLFQPINPFISSHSLSISTYSDDVGVSDDLINLTSDVEMPRDMFIPSHNVALTRPNDTNTTSFTENIHEDSTDDTPKRATETTHTMDLLNLSVTVLYIMYMVYVMEIYLRRSNPR